MFSGPVQWRIHDFPLGASPGSATAVSLLSKMYIYQILFYMDGRRLYSLYHIPDPLHYLMTLGAGLIFDNGTRRPEFKVDAFS